MKRKRIIAICSLLCCAAFVLSIAFSALNSVVLAGETDVVYGNTVDNDNFNPNTGTFDQTGITSTGFGNTVDPSSQGMQAQQGGVGQLYDVQGAAAANASETTPPGAGIGGFTKIDNLAPGQIQIAFVESSNGEVSSGSQKLIAVEVTQSNFPENSYIENVEIWVELPAGTASSVVSKMYAPGSGVPNEFLVDAMRPYVKGVTHTDGKDYAVITFPALYSNLMSTTSGGKREFDFMYTPFTNGVTPNGTTATLTGKLLVNGQTPVNAEDTSKTFDIATKAPATNVALAYINWQGMLKSVNPASKKNIAHDADGKTAIGATYTVEATPEARQSGKLFTSELVITDSMTLPEGVSVPFNATTKAVDPAYITVNNGGAATTNDGTNITITWTVTNTTLSGSSPAELGSVKYTYKIENVDIDNALFPQGTEGRIINNTVSGKFKGHLQTDYTNLTDAAKTFELGKDSYTPPSDGDFSPSKNLSKKLLTPETQPYLAASGAYADNPVSTYAIKDFANGQTVTKTKLKEFIVEDTFPTGMVFTGLKTGKYAIGTTAIATGAGTVAVSYLENGIWENAGTFDLSASAEITATALGAGDITKVTAIRLNFGTVDADFRILSNSDENAPQISLKPITPPNPTSNTFTNEANLTFTPDVTDAQKITVGPKNVSSIYKSLGTPTVGAGKYAVNKTLNHGTSNIYPGDSITYTIAVWNKDEIGSPWINPLVVDSMSQYVDPALTDVDFEVYNFTGTTPVTGKADGSYTLSNCVKVTNPNLAWTTSEPTTADANNVVRYDLKGALETNQLLLIHYTVQVKSAQELKNLGWDGASQLSIKNTFKAYHRPEGTEGDGTGLDLGGGGYREIFIKGRKPQFSIQKQVSLTEGSGYASTVQTQIGNTVYYQITATNVNVDDFAGDTYKANAALIDVLPPGFEYVANSGKIDGVAATPVVTNGSETLGQMLDWDLGAMDASSQNVVKVITFSAKIVSFDTKTTTTAKATNYAALFPYQYNATATDRSKPIASYDSTGSNVVQYVDDSTMRHGRKSWDNVGTAKNQERRLEHYADVTVVSPKAFAGITKSVNATSVYEGDTVTFVVSVQNKGIAGTADIKHSTMVDMLPKGLTYVDGSMEYADGSGSTAGAYSSAGITTTAAAKDASGQQRLTVKFANDDEKAYAPGKSGFYRFKATVDVGTLGDSELSKPLTNYAAFFQKSADNVVINPGSSQEDSKALLGVAEWDNDAATDLRIHATANVTVNAKYIKPGVSKSVEMETGHGSGVWSKATEVNQGAQGMRWRIEVANASDASETMAKPKVVDIIPAGLIFDDTRAVRYTKNPVSDSSTWVDLPKVDGVNYVKNADPLLAKKLEWVMPFDIAKGETYTIEYYTYCHTNYFGLAVNSAYLLPYERFFDAQIMTGKGAVTRDTAFDPKEGLVFEANVRVVSSLGAQSQKYVSVRDTSGNVEKNLQGTSMIATEGKWISVPQESEVTYDLIVQNTGNFYFSDFVIVDHMPTVGDTGVVTTQSSRNSDWTLPLDASFSPSDIKIYRGTETDIGTGEPKYPAKGSAITPSGLTFLNKSGTSEFSADVWNASVVTPSGWGASASGNNTFRITMPAGTELAPGEWLMVRFTAKVPKDVNGTAWNSFGTGLNYRTSQSAQNRFQIDPFEPLKAGVQTDDLKFKKVTEGGIKDGGGADVRVPFGQEVTFKLDDVRNPYLDRSATLTLTDHPNYKRGGLELVSITIPSFTNAGDVKYTVKAFENNSATPYTDNVSHSAAADAVITAYELGLADADGKTLLADNAWIEEIFFDFGTVPTNFKNSAPIKLTFRTVDKPADVYASHNTPGGTVPENQGYNEATLKVDNRSISDADIYYVFDLGLTISKHTLKMNADGSYGAYATDATGGVDGAGFTGIPANVVERRMYKDANTGEFTTAFALYDAVKNNSGDVAKLVLTDLPRLLPTGSMRPAAALVPYEIDFPSFTLGAGVSYSAKVTYEDGSTTDMYLKSAQPTTVFDASVEQTATFDNNTTKKLVSQIVVTFNKTPDGFEQDGDIVVKSRYVGDVSLMESISSAPGWAMARNGVKLSLTTAAGQTVTTPEDEDFASIFLKGDASEFIQVGKTAATAEPYEKDENGTFTISNIVNQLDQRAKGFRFFDIPQANTFSMNKLDMPAFTMNTAEAVSYRVYVTNAAVPSGVLSAFNTLPALSYDPDTGDKSAVSAARATIDAWLDGAGWTLVDTNADASAAKSFTLPANTAFKVEFAGAAPNTDSVPVGFKQDGDIIVTANVGNDFTGWTAGTSTSGDEMFSAINEVALFYNGMNALAARDSANISVVEFDFEPAVTKTTNLTTNPGREALLGGLARFEIGGVRNYVEGRAAELTITDKPASTLNLRELTIPAFVNAANSAIETGATGAVTYTVKVRYDAASPFAPVLNVGGQTASDATKLNTYKFDDSKHVYEFMIDFGSYQQSYTDKASGQTLTQTVVPAGFAPLNDAAISATFLLASDETLVGKQQINEVLLTNTYRGEAKSAQDEDYVIPKTPDEKIRKEAVERAVPVGKEVNFQITGIKNYLDVEARNFKLVDVPERGLYLTQLSMPAFSAPSDAAFETTYTVSAKTANGQTLRLADASGSTTFNTSRSHTIVTPAANRALGTYVTEFTAEFAGVVPAGFGQSGAIVTTFLTDPSLAVHLPDYTLENEVELTFNNQSRSSQDTVEVYDFSIDIDKQSETPVVLAGGDAIFTIDEVENELVVDADNFILTDRPHEALYLKSMTIPAFVNHENRVTYSIYARVNSRTAPETLVKENLSASQAYIVPMPSSFSESDWVGELIIKFNTVPAGFKNSGKISMTFATSTDRSVYLAGDRADNDVWLEYVYTAHNERLRAHDNALTSVTFQPPRLRKMPGNTTVVRGQEVDYTVDGFANQTGAAMENYAIDDIPQDGIEFRRAELPAFVSGSGVTYDVAYRTNLNNSWRLMATGLSASTAQTVNAPQLSSGERFTVVRVLFDSVPNGFGLGDEINFVFVVTADPTLLGTDTIINQVRFSYTTSGDTPYSPPVYNTYNTYNSYNTPTTTTTTTTTTDEEVPYSFINIPEEEVPYAPIQVKNPMAVTGEDGMAPMYWILVAIVLVIGAGLVALSSAFKGPRTGRGRR